MASAMCSKASMRALPSRPSLAPRRAARGVVKARATLDPNLIVGSSTVAFLSLGRFVFLPFQTKDAQYDSSIGPKTTGTTFFDDLQKPSSFVVGTKDPAGFTLIDVLGWGALGHAFAFLVLAISSLHDYGVNPWPANL